jgi:rhodanese-related sulfurtransferase
MKRISPKEAKALQDEGWTYLDVRSEGEFEKAHPAGAINIPLLHALPAGMSPNPDFMRVVETVLPKEAKVVVGCLSGGRSLRAAQMLEGAGYQNVVDQRAGFGGAKDPTGRVTEPGWAAENLPVETGRPPQRSYADLSKRGK